jgi:hypothetical protein
VSQTARVDWSREEVEAIVADYVQMLSFELSGQAYSKTDHRRQLRQKLRHRSDTSLEFKHCNISAVMIELGFPYIRGYQPRSNFQTLLVQVVADQVGKHPLLDQAAFAATQQPAVTPQHVQFSGIAADPPRRQERASTPLPPVFRASRRDYLEREARNQSLGIAGEELVIAFEQWRLASIGHQRLADRVEHVSKTQGDGLGFDVLSFNLDGSERFIEVKTTTFGRDTPFFVSETEVARSKQEGANFHLYRLFEFRSQPRLFFLPGVLSSNCFLDPVSYRASFN